jgi:hypothetical protein
MTRHEILKTIGGIFDKLDDYEAEVFLGLMSALICPVCEGCKEVIGHWIGATREWVQLTPEQRQRLLDE